MEVVIKKINQLHPYENNARKIPQKAVDAVAESIHRYGFRNPILVDAKNVIVAGHTRLLAAKQLNLTEVPCIEIHDLADEKVKALRIADNRTAEFSSWDFLKLEKELTDLDLEPFGFGELKIEEQPKPEPVEFDDIEPVEFDDLEAVKFNKCPKCGYEW